MLAEELVDAFYSGRIFGRARFAHHQPIPASALWHTDEPPNGAARALCHAQSSAGQPPAAAEKLHRHGCTAGQYRCVAQEHERFTSVQHGIERAQPLFHVQNLSPVQILLQPPVLAFEMLPDSRVCPRILGDG